MNKFFSLVLLYFSVLYSAQSSISIFSTETEKPLPKVAILCNNSVIGYTNSEGKLTFETKCKKVTTQLQGFEKQEVKVDKKMEVWLSINDPKVKKIETILLQDRSDPRALEILKKINDRFDENSPLSLQSYSFNSYSKIAADFDKDTIDIYKKFVEKRKDSLMHLTAKDLKQSEKDKKDSLIEEDFIETVKISQFFLWEKVQKYQFSKKYGEKITILDNRISGFQNPIYELLTLNSNLNKIPRQVRPENRNLYRYFLTDTIEIDGRKNFVIKFRQLERKQPQNRRKFTGFIYVDCDSYAIKKIENNSKKKNEGTIVSTWKPINNKWFLDNERMKIRMGEQSFDLEEKKKEPQKEGEKTKRKSKNFGNYLYIKNDYFDFTVNQEQDAKDFKGYTFSVKNADGSLLKQYRKDSLNEREVQTYEKIDSLGKKYKIEKKISFFTNLMKGKIRAGIVDLDVSQVLKYNMYEGFRLGVGVKLNEKFNPYFSPDAYISYGFKDEAWKYGVGIDMKTSLERNSFFRAEYFDDVVSAGRFNENLWNFKMKAMNSGLDLHNNQFFHYKGFKLAYESDLSNALTLNVSAKKQSEEAKFDYGFMNLGSTFQNFSTLVTLKYAPNSKNIMTPTGKFTYEQNFPEIYLNYEQGAKFAGGELNYSRIDALINHQFRTKLGVTGTRIYAGITLGNTPIWHQFEMNGLGSSYDKVNFNLTSYLGFATMLSGKYYNDKFVGTYLTHRIPWYFKTFGKNLSSLDVVYRGIIGNMQNTENHQYQFQKLDHLYQEVGVEWNNFLSTQFNLGFFYRVGYYATPAFKDNFAIQFKFNFLGF